MLITAKQRLILFFIDTKFADDQYRLVKFLDSSHYFPNELDKNLKPLLKERLITVSGFHENGTEFKYSITEKGKLYLDENIDIREFDEFARKFSPPDFMKEIILALMRKRQEY